VLADRQHLAEFRIREGFVLVIEELLEITLPVVQ
jgi:hypothetical protein